MKFRTLLILLSAVAGLSACNKRVDLVTDNAPDTRLNVINTSSDTLNFYLNGTRQNVTSNIFLGGATGYLSIKSGTQNYDFKRSGQPATVFSKSLTLDVNKHDTVSNGVTSTIVNFKRYTLYVTNTSADKAFLKEDLLTTNTDSATVRFVHTADGVAPLDVTIGDVSFKNVSFGTVSSFKTSFTGLKVINVYLAGQSVVKATQRLTLSSGAIYTLYIKGVPDGVGKSALTVGAFANY